MFLPEQRIVIKNETSYARIRSQNLYDVLPLPELHLLMGVGNHHHKLLLKVWPALVFFGREK